ncbi:hypothetical protein G4Y79_00605 [Phototrophicus methaneseepsis]|uniref:Uncharacterized protein n=1 Tax=Phototrophicus methaneseepsis TaxID=2710758 RepID=A0A7S8IDR6_9CHLR|nr:hypothetical protein [Phototrophicus methaneseepsis]QPC82905.1 hypothetical protein G4Y79_00605 [Phototrophicus methaneseepsis]
MKRFTISLILTLTMIFGFALSAQAQSCNISLNQVSAGTNNISFSFDASGCSGTMYAYVTNYNTDTELVFTSFGASNGTVGKSFGYSMGVEEGARIFLNLYSSNSNADATWSGSASSTAATIEGFTCSSDGRLNGKTCGGDNFAAYVNETEHGNTLQVWAADGGLALNVPASAIEAMPEQVDVNTLVYSADSDNYRLYKLTSGEYQLMVRKPDGKTSVMIFNLPFDGRVTTREE